MIAAALTIVWKWLRETSRTFKLATVAAVLLTALVWGLSHAYHQQLADAKAAGRNEVLDSATMQQFLWPAERALLQRKQDSLSKILAVRETELLSSVARVRALLNRPPVPTASSPALPDGSGSAATTVPVVVPWAGSSDTSLARACTALANDCEAFRATANATIETAKAKAKVDSAANVSLSFRLVAEQDRYAALDQAMARANRVRNIGAGVCAASLGLNIFTAVTR